ncbi:cyclase [Nitrosopumilus sp. b1]|uniref:cyclase family protein n=1 Tax=Nitrosopumilus sp. b1 TaxID=2109907 RepID=UPI0015F71B87|nr:cyclase family protein [Nitrosopumilus sp. b1]KAF6243154.1 cyclase [Nitrosopumilus sp. b1]
MKPIDLSLTISESISNFPGSPNPKMIQWSNLQKDGYNLELLFMSSHTGTHLDAPFHFANNGIKIHQIPLERLSGKAHLIRIKKNENEPISINDVRTFENKNGKIGENTIVIFATDWDRKIHKSNYFTNNPGLSTAAAKYLVSKKVNLVGIDSPSIDLGNNPQFPVHGIFAKNNVLIVENLTNLKKIKKSPFNFSAFPLKIQNATGSPVRAFAS